MLARLSLTPTARSCGPGRQRDDRISQERSSQRRRSGRAQRRPSGRGPPARCRRLVATAAFVSSRERGDSDGDGVVIRSGLVFWQAWRGRSGRRGDLEPVISGSSRPYRAADDDRCGGEEGDSKRAVDRGGEQRSRSWGRFVKAWEVSWPSGRLAEMLRLITIPISHYCEKARWALDRAGIAYREERHVQLVHRVAARRAGGGSTVPVLVTDRRCARGVERHPRLGR